MQRTWRVVCLAWLLCTVGTAVIVACTVGTAAAADWRQFRGPGGQGISSEKGLPTEWSSRKNIRWKTPLVGPGTSSPVTVGDRIYLTCYTGYALSAEAPGKMEDLRRHLVCIALGDGKILWTKQFDPKLPEHIYAGEGSYHGYSSSTPTSDGEHLFVFFGKSGVFCFDLDGNEIWHTSVGDGIDRWGSATSPVLMQNVVIINASVESGAIVALDKVTGKEVWRAPGIKSAWNTPILVQTPPVGLELVVAVRDRIVALNPVTGKELWNAEGIHRYVCPSLVDHDGVVYAIGGGHTSLAVRAGGRGVVTKTHVLWRVNKGSNVPSPIYADGHLFWASEKGALIHCQNAETGKFEYSHRISPDPGLIYASPLLADGKLYYVSQHNGTYVLAAEPKFKLLAHNTFEDDTSRANASIAVVNGELLLRTDQALYCIANR
jgi:outer membrane protein assembly factor BamB